MGICCGSDVIAVAEVAVALNAAGDAGCRLLVKNAGANSAFLGDDDVTAESGFELVEEATIAVQMQATDVLFAICTEDNTTLHLLRT